jgi:hypothetical protein
MNKSQFNTQQLGNIQLRFRMVVFHYETLLRGAEKKFKVWAFFSSDV